MAIQNDPPDEPNPRIPEELAADPEFRKMFGGEFFSPEQVLRELEEIHRRITGEEP